VCWNADALVRSVLSEHFSYVAMHLSGYVTRRAEVIDKDESGIE